MTPTNKAEWQALASRLAHAARNRMHATIGAEEFTHAQVRAALAYIETEMSAYRTQRDSEGERANRAEAHAQELRAQLATLRDDMARACDMLAQAQQERDDLRAHAVAVETQRDELAARLGIEL